MAYKREDRQFYLPAVLAFSIFSFAVVLGNSNRHSARKAEVPDKIVRTTLLQPDSPYISEQINSQKVIWSWPQTSDASSYLFEWCNEANFAKCPHNRMYTQENSFEHDESNLVYPGTWFARVKALDTHGNSSIYSKTSAVRVLNPYLDPPKIFDVKVSGFEAELVWSSCNAASYIVYGSADKDSFNELAEVKSLSFKANLMSGDLKYFYVSAKDEKGAEGKPSRIVSI